MDGLCDGDRASAAGGGSCSLQTRGGTEAYGRFVLIDLRGCLV